jgi:hypothetical protein
MGNDAGHSYDVSITLNVNAAKLVEVLALAMEYSFGIGAHQYDLDTKNCTDFAIDISNLCGLGVPQCNSTWPMGGGSSPGALGQFVRTMALPQGVTRNNSGGTAPNNTN